MVDIKFWCKKWLFLITLFKYGKEGKNRKAILINVKWIEGKNRKAILINVKWIEGKNRDLII